MAKILLPEEFTEILKNEIRQCIGNDFDIKTLPPVWENNRFGRFGVVITRKVREMGKLSFAYYFVDAQYRYYLNGKGVDQIVVEIIDSFHPNALYPKPELNLYKSYKTVKDRILFKLINYYKNKESLKEIPHIRFFDLAIVFYYNVPASKGSILPITVTHKHMKEWGVKTEDLYKCAMENTPKVLEPVMELDDSSMWDISFTEPDDDSAGKLRKTQTAMEQGNDHDIYKLSNEKWYYGAAAMLYPGLLTQIADLMGANLYLFPRSVHECIIVLDDGCQDEGEIKKTAVKINTMQLDRKDVLSLKTYYFERNKREILLLYEDK